MERTPGKIAVGHGVYPDDQVFSEDQKKIVADCKWTPFGYDQAKANAAFIAKAWNCHDDLLAALKRFMEYGDVYRFRTGEISPYKQAQAAIAAVEGE